MGQTLPTGKQIKDGSIQRNDLDVATVGQAVLRKIIQGTGISIASTGADSGTGDVTINATGASADLASTLAVPTISETIAANNTVVVVRRYTIASGTKLTILSGAIMRIL